MSSRKDRRWQPSSSLGIRRCSTGTLFVTLVVEQRQSGRPPPVSGQRAGGPQVSGTPALVHTTECSCSVKDPSRGGLLPAERGMSDCPRQPDLWSPQADEDILVAVLQPQRYRKAGGCSQEV